MDPMPESSTATAAVTIRMLKANRPRSRLLRGTALTLASLVVLAWVFGDFGVAELFSSDRIENFKRRAVEFVPYPLRDGDPNTSLGGWVKSVVIAEGVPAAFRTFWMAVAAIILAATGAILILPFSARNISSPRPFAVSNGRSSRGRSTLWVSLRVTSRSLFVASRSIPEYVYGFLFLGILGPHAWPLVLALAVHNFGIVGRLGAESVENQPPQRLATLRSAGLRRRQVFVAAIVPGILTRFFVFFFYRWETCLRDATVLGMLGVSSLGFLIQEARARQRYDDMIAFVLLAVVLVMIGDLVSWMVRRSLRSQR